jgi:hypothetical protein
MLTSLVLSTLAIPAFITPPPDTCMVNHVWEDGSATAYCATFGQVAYDPEDAYWYVPCEGDEITLVDSYGMYHSMRMPARAGLGEECPR